MRAKRSSASQKSWEEKNASEKASQKASDEEMPSETEPMEVDSHSESRNLECILLQHSEWLALSEGTHWFVLRPSEVSRNSTYVAVLRGPTGLSALGEVTVGECVKVNKPANRRQEMRLATDCSAIYSEEEVNRKIKCKTVWKWTLSDLAVYEVPQTFRFFEVAPRFHHKPFRMPAQVEVQTTQPPSQMDLHHTAGFFLEQMGLDRFQVLEYHLGTLSKDGAIRIGTTCSGTDVCIRVLEHTLRVLNAKQAGEAGILSAGDV